MECGGESFPEPVECELTVLQLGTSLRRDDPHPGTQLLEEAGPLAGPERRRRLDIEEQLDPGVRRVGVLPAGTTRGAESPLELTQRDRARPRDPNHTLLHTESLRAAAAPDVDDCYDRVSGL